MPFKLTALEANRTDGPYQPFTVRLALHDAISATLKGPGDHLIIDSAASIDGTVVPPRVLQITLSQVRPDGWKLTSRQTETGLEIWRLI